MIISEEQVRLVRHYLHTQNVPVAGRSSSIAEVSPDLVERVREALSRSPECRADRVAMGRELIAADEITSGEVAEKMIGRILSDSIR